MTRPHAPDPRTVIERICRSNRDADPEILATAILAGLKGHHLKIVAEQADVIAYCGGTCTRVRLENGRCPICGWSPS